MGPEDMYGDPAYKPSNPKDSVGVRKVPMHYVPPRVEAEIGLALMEGGIKYGPFNWRTAGVLASVYYDAARGHLARFWEGENIDPDSNVHHLTKAIASLIVLRDGIMQGNWRDDRPPASTPEQVKNIRDNPLTGEIIDRYYSDEY